MRSRLRSRPRGEPVVQPTRARAHDPGGSRYEYHSVGATPTPRPSRTGVPISAGRHRSNVCQRRHFRRIRGSDSPASASPDGINNPLVFGDYPDEGVFGEALRSCSSLFRPRRRRLPGMCAGQQRFLPRNWQRMRFPAPMGWHRGRYTTPLPGNRRGQSTVIAREGQHRRCGSGAVDRLAHSRIDI